MFEWLTIAAAVTIMAKAADMEGKSSVLWGVITFVLCLICAVLIPLPLINIVIGLVISFSAMFLVKIIKKE